MWFLWDCEHAQLQAGGPSGHESQSSLPPTLTNKPLIRYNSFIFISSVWRHSSSGWNPFKCSINAPLLRFEPHECWHVFKVCSYEPLVVRCVSANRVLFLNGSFLPWLKSSFCFGSISRTWSVLYQIVLVHSYLNCLATYQVWVKSFQELMVKIISLFWFN